MDHHSERDAAEGGNETGQNDDGVERRLSPPNFPYTGNAVSFDPRATLPTGAGRVQPRAQ